MDHDIYLNKFNEFVLKILIIFTITTIDTYNTYKYSAHLLICNVIRKYLLISFMYNSTT